MELRVTKVLYPQQLGKVRIRDHNQHDFRDFIVTLPANRYRVVGAVVHFTVLKVTYYELNDFFASETFEVQSTITMISELA